MTRFKYNRGLVCSRIFGPSSWQEGSASYWNGKNYTGQMPSLIVVWGVGENKG